jgi:hypothetical protein
VTDWGAGVQTWLRDNLVDDAGAAALTDAPTFEYSRGDDTGRDLTRRIRDSFALARGAVADPTASVDVAVGFHRPLTPSQVAAAIPANAALHDQSALTGIHDPAGGGWQGSVRVSTPSSNRRERGGFLQCADSPGDRNVEMEAMVYPETPRWSDNWETNNARKYTQTNMPGNIHQDDIASGDDPFNPDDDGNNPFGKSKYPDFAIVAQSSRSSATASSTS